MDGNDVKAIILVGGPSRGTRFRPLSLETPKPLFPIAGRAVIWHHIQALDKVGLQEVILVGFYEDFVFRRFIDEISDEFPNMSVRYLREYKSLGTAGGLYHFRDTILKGRPSKIFVIHADIACNFPLAEMLESHAKSKGVGTILGVKVHRDVAHKFGCIVSDPSTAQVLHYVEKPDSFISDMINGGVYLFDASIFEEIRNAMRIKTERGRQDPMGDDVDERLRLEQDLLAPLAAEKKIFVFAVRDTWRQIKSAGSAIPANALYLSAYKHTNPDLLQPARRSRARLPSLSTSSAARPGAPPQNSLPQSPVIPEGETTTLTGQKPAMGSLVNHTPTKGSDGVVAKVPGPDPNRRLSNAHGAEVVEPVFIDPSARIDPSAKIGPNVSIGSRVSIGKGVRIKNSIILDGAELKANSCVLHSIVGWDSKIGEWSRIEGTPITGGPGQGDADGLIGKTSQTITILAKDTTVAPEIIIKDCIVLPHKELKTSSTSQVLL